MLFSFVCYGQELPTIIPPSPEASALSKFTDIPVSHYTGLPNISVPIYTIQTKGITIPISLNYHARGIQVSEIVPRTGLGWSLQLISFFLGHASLESTQVYTHIVESNNQIFINDE